MQKDSTLTAIKNLCDILLCQLCFTVKENLITFNADNLTGIFIYKVFNPTLQNTGCQLLSKMFLQCLCRNLNLFSKIKNFKNISVIFKADST